eukprot:TRINITY_DN19208_c0_g1_i1.p1 TRINITY_DN19208_c0_g1~~TRINITY_DN19208_c0_g1_i1.p1  ORF type:complete len:252 (-),score=53.64 TRINITY_DN19208_c0_g1_i1:833-1588(-)
MAKSDCVVIGVALFSLLATGAAWSVLGPSNADPCKAIGCPEYKIVKQGKGYEIRLYSNASWVETEPGTLLDVSFNSASTKGFYRLFNYIQGANEESKKIPMTAPVLTSIIPSAGPFCSSSFTVKFFVPYKVARTTIPKPNKDLQLEVTGWKSRCVAVHRFGGFAQDSNVGEEAAELAASLAGTHWENLTKLERTSGEEVYGVAQYNAPFEFFDRRNEIWVHIPSDDKYDDCRLVKPKSAGDAAAGEAAFTL